MDHQEKGHVNRLLEHGWFFGNSLANKSRSVTPTTSTGGSKMVRCFSDPSPSTSAASSEAAAVVVDRKTANGLQRTPSLPPCWGRDAKYSDQEEDEEEEEPSMGDLIRQAMPLPVHTRGGRRRLDRTPSLPPCRAGKVGPTPPPVQNGVLLQGNGLAMPSGMPKLSRRATIDSSMVLPPKYTSKNNSNSKNRPQRKVDVPNVNIEHNTKEEPKPQNLNKIKSQKSPSALEIEELQGFKDLGFSFDDKKLAQVWPKYFRPYKEELASVVVASETMPRLGDLIYPRLGNANPRRPLYRPLRFLNGQIRRPRRLRI